MFCTIMSTLMLASASGPKIAAATPGLSGTWRSEICASSLEKAMPVTTCCSTISSSSQISVPGGVPCGSMSSGLSKLERTKMRHLVHHAELDRAHLQHLGAERGQLQHFLEGDLVEALRARHDARVGGVDAVDVGVDVAAVGLDRGGDRHRRGVGAAAAERGDAAGVLVHALEAGDHRDLLALLEALDQLGAVDVEDARRAVRVGGQDRQLPALPGARR